MSRKDDWDAFGFGFRWDRAFRGPWMGWGRRRGRWFESGDLKYVILKLLRDKPRHGYEVMKELGEQLRGCYSPSPGSVYPTLQWLEDEGLVAAREVDGKKVYEITDAGRRFLEEHRDVLDDILERVRDAVERTVGGAMGDVNRAVSDVLRAAYRTGWRARDDETRRRVAEILRRAAEEIAGAATAT